MNNSEKIDNLNKLIRNNNINDVISYIKESNVNINDYSTNHNCNGEFPLKCAVYFNKYEIVKYLLQNGANINQKDNRGENSLFDSLNSLPDKKMLNLLISYNIEFGNIFDLIQKYEETILSSADDPLRIKNIISMLSISKTILLRIIKLERILK